MKEKSKEDQMNYNKKEFEESKDKNRIRNGPISIEFRKV